MPDPEVTLQQTQELFDFLQGTVPKGMHIGRGNQPRLTRRQAFTVIWYLQEHLRIIPDNYEMCHRRGCDSDLYDAHREGCMAGLCEMCADYRCPNNGNCEECPNVE